ncbi:MAG TPA: CRTAC1 family protein [Candidatus Sulfotelmatobacter sp.]|nr:CRTAC1 family protein [Candidatus Sulfotelmatobacter sp.]
MSLKISRRTFVSGTLSALLIPRHLLASPQQQGIASRGIKPQARPTSSGRPFNTHFVDVAKSAGLHVPTIYGGVETKKYILEANGCGCAFIDYDNDGWVDIFLLCGTRLEGAPEQAGNRLYKNNRDGTFTDVTESAGLHAVGWANGVCVGDYNNDGFEDIFCTYFGQNRLYRNNGDGTFTEVTKQAGLLSSEARWGAGCSFVDYNRDGHLDLFVSNYVRFDLAKAPVPGEGATCNWKGIPVNCGPMGLPMGRHLLYRNNGDGTFTDVSKDAGIDKAGETYGMTVVAADFDEDGWADIFVACDSSPSLLFMNNHDGTFREEGLVRGVALSDDGMDQAGMGVGIGDYDLDGHLDIFKTHFMGDTCGIFRNDGKGNFDDRTRAAKIGVETRFVNWGTGVADLDNDGYPDIFIVTGSVYPEAERKLPDSPYKTPRIVFRNLGNGSFEELGEEAGPAVVERHSSRGCAFGDFDNDGDMDVLIINMNEPPSLLRNDLPRKENWIKIMLEGVKSNRSAIGARVLVHYGNKVQAQARVSQSSYYSASDPRLHFGLGDSKTVDVDIYWPNGLHERHTAIPANQLVTIQEGKGIVSNKGWSR